MYYATNRTYTCKHTARVYTLLMDDTTKFTKMVDSEGKELTEYLASEINGIEYKWKGDGTTITLNEGELINSFLTVGKPTHKKYAGQRNFRKI